jgi:hypothetical protein
MIKCLKCGKILESDGGNKREAVISGSIMGDEYVESYFFCDDCQVYTVEIYRDKFSGPEQISMNGPLSKKEGDKKISIIKRCKNPWDKKCRCKAHRKYFGGMLD